MTETEEAFYISPQQRRLWTLRPDRDPGPFVAEARVRVDGPLDAGRLRQAVDRTVRRHEVLRTRLRRFPGLAVPVQVVLDAAAAPWAAHGLWDGAGGTAPRARFDLEEGPCLEASLVLEEGGHLLVLRLPACFCDGAGLRALVREIAAVYAGEGEEEPLQYPVVADWLNQLLEAEEGAAGREHWHAQDLAALREVRRLPLQPEIDPEAPFLPRRLPVPLATPLRAEPAALLAVWQALLGRLTGGAGLAIGVFFPGRGEEGLDEVPGLLERCVPLALQAERYARLRELAERAAQALREGEEWQHSFTWDLVPAAGPVPFAPFSFAFAEHGGRREAGGVRFLLEEETAVTDRFWARLSCRSGPAGVTLDLEYDAAALPPAEAERLAERIAAFAAAALAAPEEAVGALDLVGAAERRWLAVELNRTAIPFPLDACLHEHVAAQEARTPDGIALVAGERRLTWAELGGRARQLARRLRGLGVGPDIPVALLAGRSPEMVCGLLGVLTAGGAYLPLDPDAPAARLGGILDSARPAAVLADRALAGRLAGWTGPLLWLDDDDAEGSAGGALPLAPVSADNLAYVIYTSGSTGAPKGVMVPHRAISNRLLWMQAAFPLGPDDRVLQKTAYTFDASIWEIFLPLMTGARLVLAGGDGQDAALLLYTAAAEGVTTLQLVPSLLRVLLQSEGIEACTRLVRIFCGGEALTAELPALLAARSPARLHNLYGPTEAAIDATCQPAGGAETGGGTVPIGRPIANVQVYLLDGGQRLVPAGLAGELCIGGAGLARGYLDRPDLTAERFQPNPFGAAGGRLYRTGDLARHLADGRLEFLGRLDHQVKLRGFRIELGEIEAALRRHPGVSDAVASVFEDTAVEPQLRRLIAHVSTAPAAIVVAPYGEEELAEPWPSRLAMPRETAEPAVPVSPALLRDFLRGELPEYMVPSQVLVLADLPRTSSGKIDRRALPAPDLAAGRAFVAPRDGEEELLAGIWRELLGAERIGAHDNFFELGGDSILAIQVVARINRHGHRLRVRQLFQRQTVAELAAELREAPAAATEGTPAGPWSGPMPLLPAQLWFFEQGLPEPHHYNQALLLEIRGEVTPARTAALVAALRRLAEHHDALRLRFAPAEDGWRQWAEPPGAVADALVAVDLAALGESWRRAFPEAVAAVQGSLDLARGPLLRAALITPGGGRPARLLLAIHHLAVDAVSWRVLLEDLEALWRGLLSGAAVELPRTASLRDWAGQAAARARDAEAELSFWLQPERALAAPLPLDDREAADTAGDAASVSAFLEAEETRRLLQEAPRAYRTRIDDLLLTALARTLARWTGDPRVLVDLEGHGREEAIGGALDGSRIVGWLTRVHPALLAVDPEAAPAAALKAVKEQLRAVPEHGARYGLLRYLGRPETAAALRALPVAEVSFNNLGQVDQVLAAGAPFVPAAEESGPAQSPRQPRRHALDVLAVVQGGRLRLTWTYGGRRLRRVTAEALAAACAAELRELIAACTAAEAGGLTPSDVPLAGLDQQALDRMAAGPDGREIEDLYPLSPLQQGLLFHSLDAAERGIYFRQLSCRVLGPLDTAAFRRACEQAMERHTVLRTAFATAGLEEPLQKVMRLPALPVEERDWSALDPAAQEGELRAFLAGDRARGFALERAPLMRLAFLRLGPEDHRLVWSFHHLISDGWSFPLLVTDVLAAYAALRRGTLPEQPRPRPFRDYIAWLARQDEAAAEAFWRRTLAGFTLPTPLPAEGEAGAGTPAGWRERHAALPAAETAALQAWARRRQVTLNTVVQGAWALVLGRAAGERDVVFGAVTSGRPADLPGVEAMIGPFINTLPVRVALPPDELVGAWLRGLRDLQAEAREHEHVSLADVQAWSGMAGGQLFRSLLVFENYPLAAVLREPQGGLRFAEVEMEEATNYPLTLVASVPAGELALRLGYDAALFTAPAVERMLAHLATVMAALAGAGEGGGPPLALLPLLTPGERAQVLREWSDTAAPPPALPVHAVFARQAALTPDATALVAGGESLTYAALAGRAGRIAAALRRRGAAGAPVAVLLDRTADLPAALLAVFQAGGAFVPLDAAHPRERLAFLLEDSGAELLVTRSGLLGLLPAELPGRLGEPLLLDRLTAGGEDGAPTADPADDTGLGRLAYILYTSGSTGRPKGVLVEHGQLAHTLLVACRELAGAPGDVLPCLASSSFDIFFFELLSPLLAGATCLLVPRETVRDAARLAAEVLPTATRLHAVPGLMRQIVEAARQRGGAASAPGLRTLLVGGDTVPPGLLRAMREVFPAAEIRVLYGPTEATILCASWTVPAGEGPARTLLGRPLPGVRLRLCGPDGRPVPIGGRGEIWIGGGGVARGYLRRAERTAELFPVVDGERFYRSGDAACWLPDGSLEFLGRIDDQVKIRGVRVEPGEVEASLAGHPRVRAAAVVTAPGPDGSPRLVAFAVPAAGELTAAALRSWLAERLPEALVPPALTVLDELPLLPSGKPDRAALRRRAAQEPTGAARAGGAPRTPLEELLAGLFARVLGVEQVGVDDNFFDLGGHSLSANRLVLQTRSALDVELPVRAVFEAPTVAALARTVDERLRTGAGQVAPPLRRVPRGGPLPASFAQRRLWFLQRLDPESVTYNVPLAVRLEGEVDPAVLAGALTALCLRHESLRTTFDLAGDEPTQLIGAPAPAALPVVDLRGVAEPGRGAELERLAWREEETPFDLERGPLLRATFLSLEEGASALLLTLHHAISDGWSMEVLLRDLLALYQAVAEGRRSPLPELPVQVADHAAWQRSWLRGEVLAAELAGWRRRLAGAPTLLEVPTDRPRPPVAGRRGRRAFRPLPGGLVRPLRELGRKEGATLFMTVLAAFDVLLSQRTGSHDFLVGTAVAGRHHPEVEGLIGCFVNLLPLRADLGGDPTFRGFLRRVRVATLDASLHQDLPFEVLVDDLGLDRSLAWHPLVQVAFHFDEPRPDTLDTPGVRVRPVLPPTGETRAQFDLTLNAWLRDGELGTALTYNTDLFRPATAERLLADLEVVVRRAAEQPDLPLSALEAGLAAAERERHAAFEEELGVLREERFKRLRRREGAPSQEPATAGTGPETPQKAEHGH